MGEKTRFSEAASTTIPDVPPDAKACANCSHARISTNAAVMRKVATCKALPKFPVAVPSQGGVGIQFFHPTMDLFEECDLFDLKTPSNGAAGPVQA